MRPCLPIFLNDQSLKWEDAPLKKILKRNLSLVSGIEGCEKPVVITDSRTVSKIATSLGFRAHFVPASDRPIKFYRRCLQSFSQARLKDPALFIDFRYPILNPQLLVSAVQKHRMCPHAPLITLKNTVRNHPYHLKRMIGVIGTGVLHLFDFDQHPQETKDRLSRPFPWTATKNICASFEQGQLSVLPTRNGRVRLRFSGPFSLAQVGQGVGTGPALTINHYSGHHRIETTPAQNGLLMISPFDSDGIISKHNIEVRLVKGSVSIKEQELKGIAGFLYVLLKDQDNREVDFEIPFDPAGLLWLGNTDLNTGTNITGRQHLPELFEAQGPFLIATEEQLRTLLKSSNNLQIQGIIITKEQSICLRTKVDLIRFQVMERISSMKQ